MERIIVIGCPGSGKSTFARKMSEITKLPLYYLDMLNWNEDKTTVPKDVFRTRLREILKKERWIIDGNYSSTMEMRLVECDTVFFLNYPVDVCLEGVKNRKGIKRPDMPWIETEDDEEFLDFIKNFKRDTLPRIIQLLKKYSYKKIIIFESRDEGESYLQKLATFA